MVGMVVGLRVVVWSWLLDACLLYAWGAVRGGGGPCSPCLTYSHNPTTIPTMTHIIGLLRRAAGRTRRTAGDGHGDTGPRA